MEISAATPDPVVDNFGGPYAFLSNFAPSPVRYEGMLFPTVEHAYQAQKTLEKGERALVAALRSPGRAKRAGKRLTLRPDWESIKIRVMTDLIRLKFRQAALREKLLATGNAVLREGNTWNDRFWGVCRGEGQNWLGRILMQVRDEIRNSVSPTNDD